MLLLFQTLLVVHVVISLWLYEVSAFVVVHNPKSSSSPLSARTRTSSSLRMSSEAAPTMLDPAETAVVLIEYQNEFTTPGGKLHDAVKECMDATGMLQKSRHVMDEARNAGCTIVHCPISFERGHKEIASDPYGILAGVKDGQAFTNGEWGAEICDTMTPKDGDLVVKGKSGLCGFHSTNLDFLLRQNGIKNVVLGGFLTNCCVESTMRNAYEKGYKVYTLKDCVAATSIAGNDAAIEHTFGMFSVPTTSNEFIAILDKTPVSA